MIAICFGIIILIFSAFFFKKYSSEKRKKDEFIERIKIKEYGRKINQKIK